jgi:hypothetical protein
MKLQLTLIDDGIPVDRDDPVIPVVDTVLGNLTWVQRYVGRSEIPLPHQVVLSFRGGGEAMRVFHYIWTKGFQRSLPWIEERRKAVGTDSEPASGEASAPPATQGSDEQNLWRKATSPARGFPRLTSCPIKIARPWSQEEREDGSVVLTQWEVQ